MTEKLAERSFEQGIQDLAERHFVETIGEIANYAASISMETGERGDEPFTDMFFVLEEGTHTPGSLSGMQVDMGLNSEVSALITPVGNGILVNTPLSFGRMTQILHKNPTTSQKLIASFTETRDAVEHAKKQRSLDSSKVLRQSIAASLGSSWTGDR